MEVDGDAIKKEANGDTDDDDDDDNKAIVVEDLARALYQISKCLEDKYLNPPLGKYIPSSVN